MPDTINDIVIVGGGLAAAKAAEAAREHGYDRDLTIVTDEVHRPYERPPLSKQVLTGDADPTTAFVHGPSFYDDHDIRLVTADAAISVDAAACRVTLGSGTILPYDRLLLATGARARQLALTDRDLAGIVTLRTLDEALRLHDDLAAADHVTIVGAGWIGCEVAAAARTLGTEVTLVDPLDTPLQRVLGSEVGRVFADLHSDHGVDLRLGLGVTSADGRERVERVTLSDGSEVVTDLVVVGVGVVPRMELAEAAGLRTDNGIVTDQTLTTSDPKILAAGDVANAWHPHYGSRLRVEHWANALHQGLTAGANLLGAGQAFDRLPYFFSDQYDLGMEYVGHAAGWDQVVFRGDRENREFIAFWLQNRRVVAAMNVNVWDVADDLRALIAQGLPLDPGRLGDPDVPLTELLGGIGREVVPQSGL